MPLACGPQLSRMPQACPPHQLRPLQRPGRGLLLTESPGSPPRRGETLASRVICRACGLVLPSINQVQGGSDAGEDPGRALGRAGDRAQELAPEMQAVAVSVGSSYWERRAPEAAPALALRSNHFHLCYPRLLTLRDRASGAEEREMEEEKARGTGGEKNGGRGKREGDRESQCFPL